MHIHMYMYTHAYILNTLFNLYQDKDMIPSDGEDMWDGPD